MEKIKSYRVNYVNGAYWYQPSLWTFSKREWAARPFKSIEDLISKLELNRYPGGIIDINKDPRFVTFNNIQQVLKTGISINPSAIKEKDNLFTFEIAPKIQVILNDKSLKSLRTGKLFCIPLSTFQVELEKNELCDDEVLQFLYVKNNFEISKIKIS
ncbi:MPN499 family protein [Mycoplasmopsis primatum]|uniref:MPN499 family protein n=1 Tax=Mycoplasmopsis primatum TaxID=55604 RepID=UPI0004982128|nr:hypothetical protein [Mycoplasmopsis primatum]